MCIATKDKSNATTAKLKRNVYTWLSIMEPKRFQRKLEKISMSLKSRWLKYYYLRVSDFFACTLSTPENYVMTKVLIQKVKMLMYLSTVDQNEYHFFISEFIYTDKNGMNSKSKVFSEAQGKHCKKTRKVVKNQDWKTFCELTRKFRYSKGKVENWSSWIYFF